MQYSATKWQRFYYGPLIPLGEDGRIVTGSKGGGGSGNVIVAYIKNLCQAMEEKADEGKVEVFTPLCDFYRENVEAQYEEGNSNY